MRFRNTIAILLFGVSANAVAIGDIEQAAWPTSWFPHNGISYNFYDEDEGHACRVINGSIKRPSYCYTSTINNKLVPPGVYRNCEYAGQCSSSTSATVRHSGIDFDDPRHNHKQEDYGFFESLEFHGNIDKILAAASGEVVRIATTGSDEDHGFGTSIVIRHYCSNFTASQCIWDDSVEAWVIFSQYSHMQAESIEVEPDQWVSKGDHLGKIGGSGFDSEREWIHHLHFEFKVDQFIHGTCPNDDVVLAYLDSNHYTLEECGYRNPWHYINSGSTVWFYKQNPKSIRAVYRFWSGVYKAHFYTSSLAERDSVIANDPNWEYEGVGMYIPVSTPSGSVPLYRFWSENFRRHFYTASESERAHLVANDSNWNYEGIAFNVFPLGTSHSSSRPFPLKDVHRFYKIDSFSGVVSHFYTASEAEKNHILSSDHSWNYEGKAFMVYETN